MRGPAERRSGLADVAGETTRRRKPTARPMATEAFRFSDGRVSFLI
jgi:hypothetical protein